jgi:hypothetical protein
VLEICNSQGTEAVKRTLICFDQLQTDRAVHRSALALEGLLRRSRLGIPQHWRCEAITEIHGPLNMEDRKRTGPSIFEIASMSCMPRFA